MSTDEEKEMFEEEEGEIEGEGSRDSMEPKAKRRKKIQSKLSYRCTGFWREDHEQPLYGVSVNPHIVDPSDPVIFATVGYNRVTVYEAGKAGVRLVQCYADPDPEENFYTCAWSLDTDTKRPLLAAAGSRGIIRLFSTASMTSYKHLLGHGKGINELKFHPKDPNLLLSASSDHALRVWNVKTGANIVMFGGVEGHRDEVLSADFNETGDKIVSCGLDHSLKIWNFGTKQIQDAVQLSYKAGLAGYKTAFPTVLAHFPEFSTRDIHRNYVDCCRWFGDFLFSKSCENNIVCWIPKQLETRPDLAGDDDSCTVIHTLDLKDCDIWFIRFCMDAGGQTLALGNRTGKIYVWDLDVPEPSQIRCVVLSHPSCNSTVRQTSMSHDGRVLISVCHDGTIWRWEKN